MIGKINSKESKQTSKGASYILLKINGESIGDWDQVSKDLSVGDSVEYSYELHGNFRNLSNIAKVEGNAESVNPAFFGMCANQAIDLSVAVLVANGTAFEESVYKELVKKLYRVNKELWNELSQVK